MHSSHLKEFAAATGSVILLFALNCVSYLENFVIGEQLQTSSLEFNEFCAKVCMVLIGPGSNAENSERRASPRNSGVSPESRSLWNPEPEEACSGIAQTKLWNFKLRSGAQIMIHSENFASS